MDDIAAQNRSTNASDVGLIVQGSLILLSAIVALLGYSVQAKLKKKERRVELEEQHRVEIKVYKQKVKHLLYEHGDDVTRLKTDAEHALKTQADDFRKRSGNLSDDKRQVRLQMKETELAHEDVVRSLKLDHAKEITKLRSEFALDADELRLQYEKKQKTLRDTLEHQRKHEIHEVEERKNTHINLLMKKHESAFGEIKTYYNDVTHNNLDLIKTLKEDVSEMKAKEATNDRLMFEISRENKKLSEPLSMALREVDDLRRQMGNFEKNKVSLQNVKQRLSDSEKGRRNVE